MLQETHSRDGGAELYQIEVGIQNELTKESDQ